MLSEKAKAVGTEITRSRKAQDKALLDLLAVSRSVVGVLRDQKLPTLADDMARAIHIYDCELQVVGDFIQQDGNMSAFLEILTAGK